MILGACSTVPNVVHETEIQVTVPPPALVRPCSRPYRVVTTTGELVARLTATEGALAVCAAQVDNLRQWREETLASVPAPD
jgi:hypothetical protein